jgi:ribosome-binding factor A
MAMAGKKDTGPSQRALSIGEKVRKALTGILAREDINDPLLAKVLVSVTEVQMSTDLKLGTAYVTILGQTEVEPYVDALNRHAKFFRGKLGPALRQMKYMPEVRFRADTSFDNYARIDALLRSPEVARDLDDSEKE